MADQNVHVGLIVDADMSAVKASMDALQHKFNSFGLNSKFGSNIAKEFDKFNKAYDTYQSKLSSGIKTPADYNATVKALNTMKSVMSGVEKEAIKIGEADPFKAFANDSGLVRMRKQIEDLQQQIKNFKFDPNQLNNIFKDIKPNIGKNNTNIPNLISQIQASNQAGNYEQTINGLNKLQNALQLSKQRNEELAASYDKGSAKGAAYAAKATALGKILERLASINPANLAEMQAQLARLSSEYQQMGSQKATAFQDFTGQLEKQKTVVERTADSLQRIHKEEFGMQRQVEMIDRQIQSYFGLTQILRKVMNIARQAMTTVKELDKSMTETAVVTNFDVGDMWEKLPQYTAAANQLGSTIKDVYDATTLYYQQGLNSAQAMSIATETLKMARIGGIEAAEATDMMTAALRGFNMQINEVSAQKINDVYSKLAAMSASNTRELGEAMERTASIANSAGMDFGNTSAFLAQMIETTREAPENLGTAMKTIVARFQEMKKSASEIVGEDGELLDVNRVDKALKSIGISVMEDSENFTRLDKVFLEISERWDSLTMAQQRYIATMAAGSRQQSRFIALVGNHERLMELVDGATNSAGASQEQFNKTLESMDTKLNKLKNAWDLFTMGLLNDKLLKGAVDGLTGFMTVINKIIDGLSGLTGPFKGVTKSVLTLVATMSSLSMVRGVLSSGISSAFNWFSGKKSIGQILNGAKEAAVQGTLSGNVYVQNMSKAIHSGHKDIGTAISEALSQKAINKIGDRKNYTLAEKNQDGIVPQVRDQIKAIQQGNLEANADNLASIKGGLMQSLANNPAFQELMAKDGMHFFNDYTDALGQQLGNGDPTQNAKFREGVKAANQKFIDALNNTEAAKTSKGQISGEKALADAFQNQAQIPTAQLDSFVKSIGNANNGIMQLGMLLQNTPLAPFGKILSVVSMAASALTGIFMGLGGVLASAAAATLIHVGALKAEQIALLTSTAFTEADTAAKWKLIATNGLLGKSLIALVAGFAAIALVVAAVVAVFKAFTADADRLKALSDRAAAANDAFTSVKQEASELTDKLKQLDEYDTAFETLVSGTTEFNQKLIESNDLVTELIKKFPELTEKGYVTTDQNGRMNISQAGRDYIKQTMAERQARAQAIDIFATADYKKEKARQDAKQTKEYQAAALAESSLDVTARYRKQASQNRMAERAAKGEETTKSLIDAAEVRANAQYKVAQEAGISSMISAQKELFNPKALTSVLAGNYDILAKSIEADKSGKDRAEAYAKAYGYEYISGNKFKDSSGNEIEVAKDVWNDKITNQRLKANEQIIKNADAVDSALSKLNYSIGDVFSDLKLESDSIVSDILSNNINTSQDDLKKFLTKEGGFDFSGIADSLSEKEKEALKSIGIENIDAALADRAQAIMEAQQQQDSELAGMMAQASGISSTSFESGLTDAAGTIDTITQKLSQLKQEEKSFLVETGNGIKEAFGNSAMSSFITTFVDGNDEIRKSLQKTMEGVDWTSSIDQLKVVTELINSSDEKLSDLSNKKIKKLGQNLKNSITGNSLLNNSMQELFAAEDFQKASENMDNFVDSTGKLNATGIHKMAEESSTLNKILDTGAISAGGLAAAINATSISGSADITDLSDSVLELIGYFTQLDDTLLSAHDYIENFDPGIDTGEGYDFITENIEKAQEFIKNKELGNQQLHGLIQSVIGGEQWENTLQKFGGDYEKTINALKPQLNSFAKGYDQMWKNLTQGKDSTGKQINFDNISKDLKGIELQDKGDHLELELAGHTTEELNRWLQETQHVGKEQADLMIQDWANYSPDFYQESRENNFNAGLKNGAFVKDRTIDGTVAVTRSELNALSTLTGESNAELLTKIQESAEKLYGKNNVNDLKHSFNNITEEGDLRTDYAKMAKQYNDFLKLNKESYVTQDKFQDQNGVGLDINKILQGYTNAGFATTQAQGMAFEEMKKNGQETYTYNGQEVDLSQLTNVNDFVDKLAEIDQNQQWYNIGQQIAQGVTDYIQTGEVKENTSKTENDYSKLGANGGDKDRLAAHSEEVNNAMLDTDVSKGASSLGKLQTDLQLSKKAVQNLNEEFFRLNGEALLNLDDASLQKIGKTLGDDSKSVDELRAKISSKPFIYKQKLSGVDLEAYVDKIQGLTKKQKSILLNTKLSGQEKAEKYLNTILKEFGNGDTKTKQLIVQATEKFANGDSKGGTALLEKAGITGEKQKEIEQDLSILYNGSIANESDLQATLQDKINEIAGKAGEEADTTVTITTKFKKEGKQPKAKNQTAKVKYKKGEQENPDDKKAKVNYIKGTQDAPETKTASVNYTLGSQANPSPKTVDISPNFTGTWEKTLVIKKKGPAKGQNQNYPIDKLNTGSLASGNTKPSYIANGRIGPKDQGGLTLTGELGYEVAWIPSEGRSMIVGADGPQMINLPKDAVVWNHEQSKKILGQKSVPIGTQAKGTINAGSASRRPENTPGGGGNGNSTGNNSSTSNDSGNNKNKKKGKGATEHVLFGSKSVKLLQKWGKITNWWENISRKVDGIERIADRNQKRYESILNRVNGTVDQAESALATYEKSLEKDIQLNQQIVKKYNKELTQLATTGGAKNSKQQKALAAANKNEIKLAKAQARYEVAKSTDSKKDDKKAKKQVTKARKARDKALKTVKNRPGISRVTWEEEAVVKTRKGKKGKPKKNKQTIKRGKNIDWTKIIQYDAETDTYVANTKAINNAARLRKGEKPNKKAAKAIQEEANKKIDEKIQRRDAARDKETAAREKINEANKQLINTFYGWENELNKILKVSKQIELSSAKVNQYQSKYSLFEAKLNRSDYKQKGAASPDLDSNLRGMKAATDKTVKEYQYEAKLQQQLGKAYAEDLKNSTQLGTSKDFVHYNNKGKKVKTTETQAYQDLKKRKKINTEGFDDLADNQQKLYAKGYALEKKWITKDSNGNWTFNDAAIEAARKKGLNVNLYNIIKTIFEEIAEAELGAINAETDKDEAEKNVITTEDEWDKNIKDMTTELMGWENSLTEIAEITERIAAVEKRTAALKTAQEYYEKQAQVTGQNNNANIINTFRSEMQSRLTDIQSTQSLLAQQRQRLNELRSGDDLKRQERAASIELKYYGADSGQGMLAQERLNQLAEERRIRKLAEEYVTFKPLADGTYDVNYNQAKIEYDRDHNKLGEADFGEIEKYVQSVVDQSKEIQDSVDSLATDITSLYQDLLDLQKQYAERAKELREAYSQQQQEVINRLKTLYSALDNAFKTLINEVKKGIDNRRQEQDNAKTEKDIQKQQQRLAVLRANTGGGNQVEIAKLEQELSNSQQSYTRTLEDQLISKLQEQGDKAAEQRERQISIMQAQRTIAEKTGIDAALINQWLANPEGYSATISNLLKEQGNWESLTTAEKNVLGQELNDKLTQLNTIPHEIELLDATIQAAGTTINKEFVEIRESALKTRGLAEEAKKTADGAQQWIDNENAKRDAEAKKAEEQREADRKAAEQAAQEKAEQDRIAKEKAAQQKIIDDTNKFNAAKQRYVTARENNGRNGAYGPGEGHEKAKDGAIEAAKAFSTIDKTLIKNVFDTFNGKGEHAEALQKLANVKFGWENTLKAYVDFKGSKADAAKQLLKWWPAKNKKNLSSYFLAGWQAAIGKAYPSYKTGGLADFTGPAWLDGTNSKPELVLNAQDTKNFIALKDVLSRALGTVGSIDNSKYTGDTTYEININVDKIEKDYDVDRVAERVKKIIVKDASYRNVTQVSRMR